MAIVTHPNGRIYGMTGSVSELGLVSLTIPHFVTTEDECFTVGAKTYRTFPLTGRNFSPYDDSGWQVNLTYEGLDDAAATLSEVWEWDPSYNEEPLEACPWFLSIKGKYGGWIDDEGEVRFPEKMPSKTKKTKAQKQTDAVEASRAALRAQNPLYNRTSALSSGVTLQGASLHPTAAASDRNPFFGVKTRLVSHVIARRTYASRDLPIDARNRGGTIIRALPGKNGRALAAKHGAGTGTWLCMAPRVIQRGNAYEIQEDFLHNIDGWPEDLYTVLT
jgi:hypothetical protein